MNSEMAYLLGMVCGNGSIRRGAAETIVAIEIPHKKLQTEDAGDVRVYVKASIADIRSILEPLIGTGLQFIQNDTVTILSFCKPNADYLIREVNRYLGNAVSHPDMRIHADVFSFSADERRQFLRGFADVTGYIRRSNYFFQPYAHRVYLEIPHNWELVADVCNLLQTLDVPVQNIDWAHPNMRDGYLTKYRQGKPLFWKKEHQIKIWANEFLPIGFGVLHKQQALEAFASELKAGYCSAGRDVQDTHRYYWQTARQTVRRRPMHPCENDPSIPAVIRGRHFDSWRKIAEVLGYGES